MKNALIIFARNPELGKVKTRLAKDIGDGNALLIYSELLSHTLTIASTINADRFVFYADKINDDDIWSKNVFHKKLQEGNDLGERMHNSFSYLFSVGYNNVVIIGTDCPELSTGLINDSFDKLSSHNVVIGPATDGGYYLLGTDSFMPALFKNKSWSTNMLLDETIETLQNEQLSYSLLTTLSDLDTFEDLKKFDSLLQLLH